MGKLGGLSLATPPLGGRAFQGKPRQPPAVQVSPSAFITAHIANPRQPPPPRNSRTKTPLARITVRSPAREQGMVCRLRRTFPAAQ